MKKLISLLICTMLVFTAVSAEDFAPQIDIGDGEAMNAFFNTLLNVTERNYRFDVTREELLEAAIKQVMSEHPELFDSFAKGAYTALDENSSYLGSDDFQNVSEDVMGQFDGIGINVLATDDRTIIGAPIDGTPAALAGLSAGDIITNVDGIDITGYVLDQTVALIRGKKGTSVTLEIRRGNTSFEVTIVRDTIKINPVSYRKLDKNNAGYVSINSFNANTSDYLDAALRDLKSQGADKIILDLRNNLGGLLIEAILVSSYFLPPDTAVVTEDFKDAENNITYSTIETDINFKSVVLINEYSASASEIVAAAISENGAGTLVGKTSFGKGTVQQSLKMKNGGAMWLTIARYLTPKGNYIHEVGIQPEHYINNKTGQMDMTGFAEVQGKRALTVGDTGEDVLAIEQRLSGLGFSLESVDEVYDTQTELAVRRFQELNDLFPYGVADLTTQMCISTEAYQAEVVIDKQLEKALELIYDMK